MATMFIPVGGLLTTHQSQFFHEPANKPASHSEASLGCHNSDTSRASRAMANVMQIQNLTTKYSALAVWLFGACHPILVTAAMNPELVTECDHRILRSEFLD